MNTKKKKPKKKTKKTQKTKQNKKKIEKDFLKSINNGVFRKNIDNVRKHKNI